MPTILKETKPIARKEHRCNYCGAKISIGTQYLRTTLVYDDKPYDWVEHYECAEITRELDMHKWCDDEGLSQEAFVDAVWEYVNEKHYDEEIDDTAEDWQDLSTHEAVLKILEEDFKKEI